MKKTIRSLLAYFLAAMLLVQSVPFAFAEGVTPSVTVVDTTCTAGSSVTVTVTGKDFENLGALPLEFYYDADVLTLNSVTVGSDFQTAYAVINTNTQGEVLVNLAYEDEITVSDAALVYLYFTVAADAVAGNTEIAVAVGDARYADLTAMTVSSSSGTLTINEQTAYVPTFWLYAYDNSSTFSKGDTITLQVNNSSYLSLSGGKFRVSFDDTLFRVKNAAFDSYLLQGEYLTDINDDIPGQVTLSYISDTAVSNWPLFSVELEVIGDVDTATSLTYAVIEAYDADNAAYQTSSGSTQVTLAKLPEVVDYPNFSVSSTKFTFGKQATSTLTLEVSDVAAADFSLQFDPEILEVAFVEDISAQIDANAHVMVDETTWDDGVINFTYINTAATVQDLPLLKIAWNVLSAKSDAVLTLSGTGVKDVSIKDVTLEYVGETSPIGKQQVAIPAADTTVFTYNGEMQTYSVAASNLYTVSSNTRTNAGSQTVTVALKDADNYEWTDGTAADVTFTFTIGKATPMLGTVSVSGVIKDTTAPADVVLTKETGPEGILVITDPAMLANQSEYHWSFTPDDSANYTELTGTVQIDVLDTVPPSVTIKVETNEWKEKINDITFGIFFKETEQVTITYADNETGSGLKETLYYVSNEAISDFADVQWSTYTDTFSIDPDGEFVIYAKATDNDGNSIIVNSDGIVLDATAPVLQGVTDGETYYGDTAFKVEESYLDILTVDDIDVTEQIGENGEYTIIADNAQHTIVVTDKAGNVTTYTVTVMKNYTVLFLADGIVVDTQTIGHGFDAELPEIPAKEGYDQVAPYWDNDGAYITADTKINAVYTINKYTVTFKVEDEVVDEVEVEHGALVTKPNVPAEEGYCLLGWYKEPECINAWNISVDGIMEDTVLYAKWEVIVGLWCTEIPDQLYTGKALKPEIEVYHGDTLLTLNKDYSVSYKNNTNVYAPVDTAEELAAFVAAVRAELAINPKAKTVMVGDQEVTIAKVPQIIITGKGNYGSKETVYFAISPVELNEEGFLIPDLSAAHTGKNILPKPVVTWNETGKAIKWKTDYEVYLKYGTADELLIQSTEAKTAFVGEGDYLLTVVGKGNFTGTAEMHYTITAARTLISKVKIGGWASSLPWSADGAVQTALVLTDSGKKVDGQAYTLTEGVDYTVSYRNNNAVGTATAVFTGMGEYIGQVTKTFKITGLAISKAQVEGIPKSLPYTGESLVPGCVLIDKTDKENPKELSLETDYTVSYSNNVNKGTATILFTGINEYTGTLKKTFKIDAYDVNGGHIAVEEDIVAPYMKGGAKPVPTITFNGKELVAGTDYTLAYKNNTNVYAPVDTAEELAAFEAALAAVDDPKAKTVMVGDQEVTIAKVPQITITGKGNFAGKLTVNFAIEPKELSKVDLIVDDKAYTPKATGLPTVTLTDTDGKKLAAGKDYDKAVSYTYTEDTPLDDEVTFRKAGDTVDKKDIIPVGTVIRVSVVGNGTTYMGEASATYRIVQQSLAKATVKVANQQYTGRAIIPNKVDITVKVGGVELKDSDYEIVSCTNNVNKGSATLTIRGVGEKYGGIKTVKFKIDAKTMFWYEVNTAIFGFFS